MLLRPQPSADDSRKEALRSLATTLQRDSRVLHKYCQLLDVNIRYKFNTISTHKANPIFHQTFQQYTFHSETIRQCLKSITHMENKYTVAFTSRKSEYYLILRHDPLKSCCNEAITQARKAMDHLGRILKNPSKFNASQAYRLVRDLEIAVQNWNAETVNAMRGLDNFGRFISG